MKKIKVLFICIHNSARSQMAEAFLQQIGGEQLEVHSAGLEPGRLNPYVVTSMAEIGYDISNKRTKSVHQYLDKAEHFDYVITVCDETSAEKCPVFPGNAKRLHWNFADPSSIKGSRKQILKETAIIRDRIKERISQWFSLLDK